jgi:hypothetical protein
VGQGSIQTFGKANGKAMAKGSPSWNASDRRPIPLLEKEGKGLLDGAANRGKDIVSARSNQAYCAHHDRQNYSQHNRVFRDVLSVIRQQPAQNMRHLEPHA